MKEYNEGFYHIIDNDDIIYKIQIKSVNREQIKVLILETERWTTLPVGYSKWYFREQFDKAFRIITDEEVNIIRKQDRIDE